MLPEAGSELSTQPDGDPGVEQSSTTWRALTAFASEQHHALRHAFDSGPAVETTGKVHHQQETSTTDHNSSKQRMQTPGTSLGLDRALQPGLPESQAALQRAVEAEVEQIQQRTSILDLNKDVVVNLDFMQGGASRAASLTVIVSLLIAATVLLAQVIKKFQLVSALCTA